MALICPEEGHTGKNTLFFFLLKYSKCLQWFMERHTSTCIAINKLQVATCYIIIMLYFAIKYIYGWPFHCVWCVGMCSFFFLQCSTLEQEHTTFPLMYTNWLLCNLCTNLGAECDVMSMQLNNCMKILEITSSKSRSVW